MWLRGNDKRAVHIMEEKGAQGKKTQELAFLRTLSFYLVQSIKMMSSTFSMGFR